MSKKLFKKFGWKKILAVALAGLTFAGTVFGLVKLNKYLKEDTKKQVSIFDVGGLDENTGKYVDDNSSIYTKNSFDAKGLEIKLDFDSNVSYQVFWYDELGEFSHCSDIMTKGSKFYTPYKHEARIEITPNWDVNASEDEMEIKWYEVSKYANQLEIRVDKNQTITKDDYSPIPLTSDVFTVHSGKMFSGTAPELVDNSNCDSYELINSGNFSLIYLDYDKDNTPQNLHITVCSVDGTQVYRTSALAGDASYENYSPLPTLDNPLEVPRGATVYISIAVGQAEISLSDFILYKY